MHIVQNTTNFIQKNIRTIIGYCITLINNILFRRNIDRLNNCIIGIFLNISIDFLATISSN